MDGGHLKRGMASAGRGAKYCEDGFIGWYQGESRRWDQGAVRRWAAVSSGACLVSRMSLPDSWDELYTCATSHGVSSGSPTAPDASWSSPRKSC